MGSLVRGLFVLITGVMGLLLVLSGVGLIQLSANLNLYSGIILLAMAIIAYFLSKGKKKSSPDSKNPIEQ